MTDTVHRWMRHHPVLAFVLATLGWSFGIDAVVYAAWGASPPMLLLLPRAWGPLVGAVVVTYVVGDSVRALLGQVTNWRISPLWYVLAVAFPLLAGEAEVLIQAVAGLPVRFSPPSLMNYVVGLAVVLFLAGGLEEFGWRGFAQPRLQRSYSATLSAAGIGILWGLWHLPLFFVFDLGVFDPSTLHWYVLGTIGQSIVYAWFYNESGGCLLIPMIAHAVHNQAGLFETPVEVSGIVARASTAAPFVAEAILAGCVVLVGGYQVLCRSDRNPVVVGVPGTSGPDRRNTQ
ncbi:MAG: lysostaphin resistance A-like protein [Halobellus sp.]|uniref:lysostaphin resistance A-like protein n=1 Tax=Halobellus sp. TaxID=1979212 RepID=UPI0035D45444